MNRDSGQTGTGGRTEEIDEYVRAVREALADLPDEVRDELLEDLPAHLTEVAAEDPEPLVDRLGAPAAYAAELRAAAGPAAAPGAARRYRIQVRRQRAQQRVARLNLQAGRLLGYERFTDFAKLLVPAWWVLRGYLAAMLLVWLVSPGGFGLLPRLGGSTILGVAVLVAFVAGSIWLAHWTPRLGEWQRRALFAASCLLAFFGLIGFTTLDENQRWGWVGETYYANSVDDGISDVFVVDEHDRVLTDVRLLDQDGNPLDLGDTWCADTTVYDPAYDLYVVRYPRCWTSELPWWTRARLSPTPLPDPTATAVPTREPAPSHTPEPTGDPSPEPTGDLSPAPTPGG